MKRISSLKPGLQFFRCAGNQVHREGCRDLKTYPERLIQLVASGHDDEKIHVATRVRCAVRVGAKEDDFLGVETLTHSAREALDLFQRDARTWTR